MRTSKGRDYDKSIRLLVLDNLAVALRTKNIEMAKYFGGVSKELADRIRTHDYKKEDSEFEFAHKLDKYYETRSK